MRALNKGSFISLVLLAFIVSCDESVESKVRALLQKMTLEEKVGQMTQLTLEAVTMTHAQDPAQPLDTVKLKQALVDHHVGSILNVVDRAYSIDYWQKLITAIEDVATTQTRLGIPVLYGIDAIHGATYTQGATLFPQAIAMAATGNPDLLKQEGVITAQEVKASGIAWNFYPVLDVARQPLWSRVYETFGEDTYLATVMGMSYIAGHQSQGVADCLKHYVGYSDPVTGDDRTPAEITERMLREVFLPPFAAAISEGAPTIMVNSSEIDGIPGHANHHLLVDILRGELGFKGFTVSDWGDIENLYKRDRVAASLKDAVRIAVMAGIDMSMVPMDYSFYDLLIELVKEGSVPMSRIDEAVSRILAVKFQLGLFDHPYPDLQPRNRIGSPGSIAANLASAQEALTLLKNESATLPLKKTAKILVAGPNANLLSTLNGGWTITWQGDQESLYPAGKKTILAAIQDKIGAGNVSYAANANDAVSAAAGNDAIILCLGEKTYAESPGSIPDLTMSPDQLDLAKRLEATGVPVILVLTEGRPRVIHSIVRDAKAVLMAYLPGMEGGRAIADALFGDVNPSGRLPIDYPSAPNALTLYDHTPMEDAIAAQYPPDFAFGSGLSYTTFAYSDLKLEQSSIAVGEPLHASVRVTNTGSLEGKDIVQLYLTDLYASVARPVRQLKGFQKVSLKPGESQEVEFTLPPETFSFIDQDNKRTIEPGTFVVTVGALSQDLVVTSGSWF